MTNFEPDQKSCEVSNDQTDVEVLMYKKEALDAPNSPNHDRIWCFVDTRRTQWGAGTVHL